MAVEDQLRTTFQEQGVSRGQIAGHVAKYATKDTEVLAQLRSGLDIWHLVTMRMPGHVRRLAVWAWLQARAYRVRDERHQRAHRWVHQFGYGGHYLTMSRRYSTTFGRLRQARRDWNLHRRRQQRQQDAERRADELVHRGRAGRDPARRARRPAVSDGGARPRHDTDDLDMGDLVFQPTSERDWQVIAVAVNPNGGATMRRLLLESPEG